MYICIYVNMLYKLYKKHDNIDMHCICDIMHTLRYFIKMYGFIKILCTDFLKLGQFMDLTFRTIRT